MERVTLGVVEVSRPVYGMWRLGDDADASPRFVQAGVEACQAQGNATMHQPGICGGCTAGACATRRGCCGYRAPTPSRGSASYDSRLTSGRTGWNG